MEGNEDREVKEGFGLDKDSRLAERREQKAEEVRPEPLDPPFPYEVVQFELDFLFP